MDYESLKQTTEAILDGNVCLNALSLAEEGGRIAGGRRNVEASLLAAADARASAGSSVQLKRLLQEKTLEEYARSEGIFFDFEKENQRMFIDEGGEARVYADEKAGYVRKIINPYTKSATMLMFLNRLSLHNYVFNDTKYELLGFTRNVDWRGKEILSAVVRQRHIQGEKLNYNNPAISSRFETEMNKYGLLKIDNLNYANQDYLIGDLHAGNVLLDKAGNFYFIDPAIELNCSAGFNGTRQYGDYSIIYL